MMQMQGSWTKYLLKHSHINYSTSDLVKVRLILLWIATSDKINQDELQELLSHARLSQDHKVAIENIALLGVQLSKTANKQGQRIKKNRKPSLKKQEVPFDLSRYVPVVKRIAEVTIALLFQELFFF
jgi:syntaxin-binding protein 1